MLARVVCLLALIAIGAVAAALFARCLATIQADRLARNYLAALVGLIGVAYVAANVFGLRAVRPLSTGPST